MCWSHRRLSESLQLFLQEDQLNLPALSGVELLVRYLVQIETAVARNPRAPDFADLDALAGSTVNEAGGLVLPVYGKYVAQLQRDEAFNLKQRRQWHEEQDAVLRRYGGRGPGAGGFAGADDGSAGGVRGRGRGRGAGRRGRGRGNDGAAQDVMTLSAPGSGRRQGHAPAPSFPSRSSTSCARPEPRDCGLPRPPLDGGRPHTLSGRAPGDPFPLPTFGSGAGQRLARLATRSLAYRCAEACQSLNRLDAPIGPCRNSRRLS